MLLPLDCDRLEQATHPLDGLLLLRGVVDRRVFVESEVLPSCSVFVSREVSVVMLVWVGLPSGRHPIFVELIDVNI